MWSILRIPLTRFSKKNFFNGTPWFDGHYVSSVLVSFDLLCSFITCSSCLFVILCDNKKRRISNSYKLIRKLGSIRKGIKHEKAALFFDIIVFSEVDVDVKESSKCLWIYLHVYWRLFIGHSNPHQVFVSAILALVPIKKLTLELKASNQKTASSCIICNYLTF